MGAHDAVFERVEYTPSAALAGAVHGVSGFRNAGLAPGAHTVAASAHVKLLIGLGPAFDYTTMADPSQPPAPFRVFVVGPHARPATVAHDGAQSAIEVEIVPSRTRELLGVSAGELGAQVVELGDVAGARTHSFDDAVSGSPSWDARFAVVERFLLARRRPAREQAEIDHAWLRIRATGGVITISALAREVGWSERHLLRRFRAATGLSPKAAARITRFERAEQLLAHRTPPATVAAWCGYYDQSHLAHERRALGGS